MGQKNGCCFIFLSHFSVSHTNSVGAQATTFLSYSDLNADQSAALSKIVALVQTKLPADPSPQVVQEIADLEERLADLRKSAGLG
jgi:hypothetical protein